MRLRLNFFIALLLCASAATAEDSLRAVKLPNGKYVAVLTVNGQQTWLTFDTLMVIQPPNPTPPVPVTTGPVTSVVIRIAAQLTPEQSLALINIRDWVDEQDSKMLIHYVLNPEAEDVDSSDGGEAVRKLVAKIPSDKSLPYCFITQKDSAGNDSIKWQGELMDAAAYISKLKELAPK